MRNKILDLLQKDARLTAKEIAILVGAGEGEVAAEIKKMEDEHVICSYGALINWDLTDRDYVTATIMVRATPQRDMGFDQVAKRICKYPEVTSMMLASGGNFDYILTVQAPSIKEVAHFVSDKLAPLDNVQSTATHFVLKQYKTNGVLLEKDNRVTERMVVSP